jgi:hypothetical protein
MSKECRCGSGLDRHALYDARGIFCSYVCDRCEAVAKGKFRQEIFLDSQYWADEPIEPEDY